MKPKNSNKEFPGADSPKVFIPIGMPTALVYLNQKFGDPASTVTILWKSFGITEFL